VNGLIKSNGAINTSQDLAKRGPQEDLDDKDDIINRSEQLAHLAELLVDPNLDELDETPIISQPQAGQQIIIEPTTLPIT
jgi:hypothetical protein